MKKLGLAPQGGNYATIHRAIKRLKLDTSHFHGQLWNKGRQLGPVRELKEYLTNPSRWNITSHRLRLRLLKEGVFKHKCYGCNRKNWLGSPIPLELEHIDGNSKNNKISNLTLLCPNCHALTPTYRGKNKK